MIRINYECMRIVFTHAHIAEFQKAIETKDLHLMISLAEKHYKFGHLDGYNYAHEEILKGKGDRRFKCDHPQNSDECVNCVPKKS